MGAADPQQQPQPEMQAGPQKVANTEFNQQIQNILLSRIEEQGQQNPNFGQAIDAGITREAALELAMILPELNPIFKAMGLFDGMGGGESAITPQNVMASAAPAQPRSPQPRPDVGASPNPLLEDEDEEEGQMPVSRGLVG